MTPFQAVADPFKKLFSGLNSGSPANQTNNAQMTPMSTPAVPTMNATPSNFTPAPTVNQSAASLNFTPATPPMTPAPATPAQTGPSSHTVRSGDTLSAIASQNGMSLKDLLALNPQFQANPNLINPGDSVVLGEGQNFTPDPLAGQFQTPDPLAGQNFTQDPTQAFTPVPQADQINSSQAPNFTPVPQGQPSPVAPTAPAVPRTSTGETINIETGGVVTPSVPTPAPVATAGSTAGAPAAPSASSVSGTPGYDSAVSSFESNLNLTPEEIANQEEINRLETSRRAAFTGESNRPIPLEFITGRQQQIEQRALDLAAPLQSKAALLQAKRTAALESSKFRVGVEEAKLAREDAAKKPVSGTSFYDPTTGKFIQAPETDGGAFSLGSGQARYDAQGNLIATNVAATGGIDATTAYKNYQLAGGEAGTKMTFAEWQGKNIPGEQSDYLKRVANQGIQSVVELLPQISRDTTGWGAFFKGKLPESKARSFAAQIDTLKANITFGSLVAMREASKTGGALGQVSDREGQLLGSALGALDQLQSADQLKTQLNKIKSSLERWNTAVETLSPGGGKSSDEEGFSW